MACSVPCPGPEHTCGRLLACQLRRLKWGFDPDLALFEPLVPAWEAGGVDSRLLNGWGERASWP